MNDGVPSPCPVCGAYSLAPDASSSALLAVCDVLVIRALEQIGRFILRLDRGRYHVKGHRPLYICHTLWPPDDETVNKALRGAWDVIPAMLGGYTCCGVTPRQVQTMLDEYVHDLVITGTEHTMEELRYRFESRLGLPVYMSDGGLVAHAD